MFFRVLSAMIAADAIDRHARRRQHHQWHATAVWAQQHHAALAPWREPSPQAPSDPYARAWDPHAPERPC